MAGGQRFGFARRKESRVEPAVVAHAEGTASQMHNLDHVRVARIGTETVVMVASMSGCPRAGGHFDDSVTSSDVAPLPSPRCSSDVSYSSWCGPSPNLCIHCNCGERPGVRI